MGLEVKCSRLGFGEGLMARLKGTSWEFGVGDLGAQINLRARIDCGGSPRVECWAWDLGLGLVCPECKVQVDVRDVRSRN